MITHDMLQETKSKSILRLKDDDLNYSILIINWIFELSSELDNYLLLDDNGDV